MYDIAVIGAGASGLAAAISAKNAFPRFKILLIEALPKVGKKILATGNGRCNLSNLEADVKSYNNPFVASVFKQYPPKRVVAFFSEIGLECVNDAESRVYPMSNSATSVLDCLRFEAERAGVEIITDTKILSVRKTGDAFVLNDTIRCKKLILSAGGKASPSQGSDGSGYTLLTSLGHKVTPLYPGLVQLTVRENLRPLKGVRVKAKVILKDVNSGKTLDTSEGEVLFTDYGLSGIAIMDISRSVKNHTCKCTVDLLPTLDSEDVKEFIFKARNRNQSLTLEDALTGILPRKVGYLLIKNAGLKQDIRLSELRVNEINTVAQLSKMCEFTVTGTKGFENAQITVGGADTREFNMKTLESEKVRGLYCTGEIFDVDAPCGGFNLQWAWSSGIVAGISAAQSL